MTHTLGNTRSRAGTMAVYLAMGLGGALLVSGFVGSMQVSTNRTMLERVMVFRTLDQVSASCFEEASGRLEATIGEIDWPRIDAQRDLGATLPWPSAIDPQLTRTGCARSGVEIGPVHVKSSRWLMFEAWVRSRGSLIVHESGFLELSVDVKVKIGGTEVRRRVTCRRLVSAEPLVAGEKPRLKVQAANLFRVMQAVPR